MTSLVVSPPSLDILVKETTPLTIPAGRLFASKPNPTSIEAESPVPFKVILRALGEPFNVIQPSSALIFTVKGVGRVLVIV